jgi:hypothetical protein
MGRAKEEGIRWDGLVHQATGIAVEAGSISIDCPHETPINLLHDEPAYELAREKFKRGELPDFKNIEEVDAAMKDAFDNAGDECVACAKNAESD